MAHTIETTSNAGAAGNRARAIGRRLIEIPPAYFVLAAVLIAIALLNPNLMKPQVLLTFIRQSAPLGVAVLGQLMVMRARSIDLSIGGVFIITNYLLTSGLLGGQPVAVLVLAPLAVGLVVGLVNGTLIALVRASAVIVTLGVSIILTGIVLFMSSGRPPGRVPDELRVIANARIDVVPVPVIIWVVAAIIVAVLLRTLIFGRYLTAIGSNPQAARFSGLPLPRIVVTTHVLSGLLAALGGVMFTAALGVGSVKFGPEIMMNSIAATILGGVTFGSGRGGVAGPFVGVVAFALLFALMTVFGIQEPGKLIVQGTVIAVAAIIYGMRTR